MVRQTVDGALVALGPAVDGLAASAQAQVAAGETLASAVRSAYESALTAVERGILDGALLRGEVLARWQELVGTGDFMRGLQARCLECPAPNGAQPARRLATSPRSLITRLLFD